MRELKVSAKAGGALLSAPLLLAASFTAHSQALEEITVTARKTTENLQEVPLAITALGAEQIDRLGIKDLNSLSQQDSSVQFDEGFTPSDTRITIRGLSPTRGRPNAATLIDGIDISSEAVSNAGGSLLIDPRLIDVERIEIVKGPQSALYGRSAFAGAIQYVTKDPADVLSGGVFVDYGLEGDEEIRGNISVPLTETLGMRINGLSWQKEGYYRNAATGQKLGDGDGSGATVTFKWEPSDTFSAKWRSDYSDDHFGVAAQTLLNDFNTLYDLSNNGGLSGVDSEGRRVTNLSPVASNCNGGFRSDYGCQPLDAMDVPIWDEDGNVIPGSMAFPNGDPTAPYPVNGGEYLDILLRDMEAANNPARGYYDSTDPWIRNLYNQNVISAFTGKFPDADQLQPSIQPDTRLVDNPVFAEDFNGTDRQVFRNSLVMEWDINDTMVATSYTGYTDAKENTATDIGKYYRDNCRPGADQLGLPPEYRAQNDCTGGDGIHDGPISFFQDSFGTTKQLSQEFRLAWDVTDNLQFTQGIQYWRERVSSVQFNGTTLVGGPQSYTGLTAGEDLALSPGGQAFFGLTPVQNECGFTALSSAWWTDDTFNAISATGPRDIRRGTDHYSWYGNLQWNITDQLKTTFEARLTREDNSITGPAQHACLTGLSDEFLAEPDDPDSDFVSPWRDANTGFPLCQGFIPNPNVAVGGFANNGPGQVIAADRIAGPGTVSICGAGGRCDNLQSSPGNTMYTPTMFPGNGLLAFGPGNGWDFYGPAPQPGFNQTLNRKDRYWAPRFTVEYFWNDDIMTYFSWSRGIKPGGFSLLTLGAFGIDANADGVYEEIEFEPERLDVWEIGAKTTLFDGRLRLNGSAFFQDFKDKQVTVQEVVGDVVGTRVRNIQGSEIRGLEIDATFQATDNLRVALGYTFLESEYTDYSFISQSANDIARVAIGTGGGCLNPGFTDDPDNPGDVFLLPGGDNVSDKFCVLDLSGNDLERTPKHAGLVNVNYTNNLFDTGLEWFAEANIRYQDSRWLEQWNITEFKAYTLTNISSGVIADFWDVQLYVNNVFDDDTITSGGGNPGIPTGSFGVGLAQVGGFDVVAGPKLPSDVYANMPNPRIVGVRGNLRFGE